MVRRRSSIMSKLTPYEAWKDSFVALGERALSEGRPFHAALQFRGVLLTSDDPLKQPLRARLLPLLRPESGVLETARRWVPFDGAQTSLVSDARSSDAGKSAQGRNLANLSAHGRWHAVRR
jgi:hypothetical protein